MKLDILYENRFKGELVKKNRIWEILCRLFFQKFVREDNIVLDIGAGYCEFINNIKCSKKYAVDLNKDILDFANSDVKIFNCPSTDIIPLSDTSVDIVFMSNFLEHLRNKEEVLKTLTEIYRVLKIGGKLMILQPNIRYVYKEYWDYFDHYIPLSDKSMVEALQIVGFNVDLIIPRFLPYTTKTCIPQKSFLIKIYLKFPIIWKIMGKQMFIISKKV